MTTRSNVPWPVAAPAPPARAAVWRAWTPAEICLLVYFGWCLLLLALKVPPGDGVWLGRDLLVCAGVVVFHFLTARLRAGGAGFAWDVARHGYAIFVALPLAYQQAGSFGTRFLPLLESRLIGWDRALFGINWLTRRPPAAGALGAILEAAYLSNYLLLPFTLGLGAALAWPRRRPWQAAAATTEAWAEEPQPRARDWSRMDAELRILCGALLAALLLCYAVFPFFPAITPRLYFPALRQAGSDALRTLNWDLLSRFSIPYGIFPSGHVAGPAALGAALAALRFRGLGLAFLTLSVLVAIATVYGDYHFASDALAGFIAGLLGAAIALGLARRQ